MVAWLAIIVYGFKLLHHVRPGAPLRSKTLMYNPANIVFRPELLTPDGLRYRKRLGQAVTVLTALVVGMLLIAAFVEDLQH